MSKRLLARIGAAILIVTAGLAVLSSDHQPGPGPIGSYHSPTGAGRWGDGQQVAPADDQDAPTSGWILTQPAKDGQIEGYASATSAGREETVSIYVRSSTPAFRADVYRMGWYGGAGAVLVHSFPLLPAVEQPMPSAIDPNTGLLACVWSPTFKLTVGRSWATGMYMIKLTTSSGFQGYVPLVVRGEGGSNLLFVHTSTTEEAYNLWGGQSLYQGRTPNLHLSRAVKVSFDRPSSWDFGAGQFFFWEYSMVRYLERVGYRPDYVTDVDVHEHPELLKRYSAVMIVGHDEYWTRQMRDAYVDAVAGGVSLAVFGGNTAYRQIRFESSLVGPDRVEVGYKAAELDPLRGTDSNQVTAVNWRSVPSNWDESTLLGAMYVSTGNISHLPWVARDTSSWVFRDTGLRPGDSLPGLVGYEEDEYYPNLPHPDGVVVLSDSPVRTTGGKVEIQNSTIYTAPSGALVFNAGTVEWSWGLDDFVSPTNERGLRGGGFVEDTRPSYRNPAAEQLTLNILRALVGDPTTRAPAKGVF
jgi:hypothetical protein